MLVTATENTIMRTQPHWDECLSQTAFIKATSVALQLREYAKFNGVDHKGIKVLNKQQVFDKNQIADAQIVWMDGPEGWAYNVESNVLDGVYTEAHQGEVLSFYNI